MDIGMLWYDDDKQRTLEEKIMRGAEYYRVKHGQEVTTCYVNPRALGATIPEQTMRRVDVPGIRVRPNGTVIMNHFWFGVEKP